MSKASNKVVRIPRSRLVFAYVMCALGACLGPFDEFQEVGSIANSTILISLLGFSVGIIVVHFVIYRFEKHGKFLHYELNTED
jgi:hypothetical protein